ncbi:hypothetical protein [Xanthomonas campestris]|uniref:Uncharacterized protein n=1 Tax=Xanthomonas campestris pv. papavericola TaxID=487881 RepID=A0AAJ2X4P4_XANCA|nr:hypothetical protein [Xanthomonas campestris]MEC3889271.1 hypothetical protein [Xanthomonas campestris pv. papavericola]
MNFDVAGPFEVTRHGSKKIITKESARLLKLELDDWEEGLSDACGCYIFGKRAGGGITPWYVGQACKTTLLGEALNPTNITNYNQILGKEGAGIPVLFFVPARTPGDKLRKRPPGKLKSLSFLEKWLISAAIEKNPNLINTKETRFLRDLHVKGVFNAKQGESTKPSTALNKALGLR